MIKKIIKAFKGKQSDTEVLAEKINAIYTTIPIDFGGGCSIQKGLLMSLLISKFKLEKTVDLGVYRGRSLFPQAIAHKLFSKGKVFGVDPYSNEAALQIDRPEIKAELEDFAKTTDFSKIFNEVKTLINSNDLQNNCEMVREKSTDATDFFKSNNHKLDLVHIDGNHDTKFAMEDAINYLPLLNTKAFIVLDDISWDSVQPAFDLLTSKMTYVDQLVDGQNDFALFAQGVNDLELNLLKEIFLEIKTK